MNFKIFKQFNITENLDSISTPWVSPKNKDIPKAEVSVITATQADGIDILFNVNVKISSNIKDALRVWIKTDSGTITGVIKDVIQNPANHEEIGILMDKPFKAGQIITWAYNDKHPTEYIKSDNGVKADNQTYSVINNIA